MNPGAIYSKSGKGVQEASGKTSLLKRADRAVLSAIDGRATLAEVAQKVGKPFDAAFEALVTQLDKDGFVRAVSSGDPERMPAASRSGGVPAAKAGGAPGPDLDFTTIIPVPKTPPKPGEAAKRAKEQESALYKARQEAEARAQAERDRLKAEGEAKARAEAEAKFRADAEKKIREETEARLKAEAEAKTKAAREAALRIAAEAKARADAEKARLEAERAKLEAERKQREEAERQAREEAEKARREAEELRQRLEEERKAREAEERRRREEEERKAREEEERRARAEAERRAREEQERARRAQEEEERARRAHEEEQERARRAHEEELERARREAEQAHAPAEPEPPPAASTATTVVPGSLDTLMADLDSFSDREEDDRKSSEAAERKQKEEKARRLREESERRAEEQAQAERREAEERRRKEEEQRRAQEDAERRAREAEEARRREAEERQRRAREAMAAAEQANQAPPAAVLPLDDIGITDQDLDMEDVRRDEALVAKESRKSQREREREAREREREERQREREREREERARAAKPVKPSKPRKPVKWGRPVAITLFVLLAAAIGVLHIMPIPTEPYERAASEVLGHPVRIGSARFSLYSGVRLDLERVRIGETANIESAKAYPELGSLFGDRKAFSRIEVDNVTLAPQALGEALFAKMKGANFSVGRVVVKQLKIQSGLALPPVEAELVSGPDGTVRTVTLRGPDNLAGKITPNGGNVEFDVTASSFALPVAPAVSLTSFAMKGTATRQGMNVASWGGALFDGALNGVANVRWAGGWHVDGVVTVRNINAAVFAPALLSEGRAEGTAKFSMSAQDPGKLAGASRIEGKFTVYKGVLGSFDLSRLIQTSGRQSSGRTQFAEMTGQGTYDRGAVALREVQISAGALNAGASADVAQSGALSGRIIADVKTATQTLRQTILLGGTVKEPQVRN